MKMAPPVDFLPDYRPDESTVQTDGAGPCERCTEDYHSRWPGFLHGSVFHWGPCPFESAIITSVTIGYSSSPADLPIDASETRRPGR